MESNTTQNKATMSIEEAAEYLSIGRNLAYNLAAEGRLPVIRLGKRLIVSRIRLEKMVSEAGQKDA